MYYFLLLTIKEGVFLVFFLGIFIYLYLDIKNVFINERIMDRSYLFDVVPSHSYYIIRKHKDIPFQVKTVVLSNLLREAISYPNNHKRFKAFLKEEHSQYSLYSKIDFIGLL